MNRTTAESAAAALNTTPNLPARWVTEHMGGGTWAVVYTAPDGRVFALSSDWPNDRTVVEYPSLAAWQGETPTLDDPTLHTVTTYADVIAVVAAEWPCNLCPAVADTEARLGEHYDVDHADDEATPLAPAATVTADARPVAPASTDLGVLLNLRNSIAARLGDPRTPDDRTPAIQAAVDALDAAYDAVSDLRRADAP